MGCKDSAREPEIRAFQPEDHARAVSLWAAMEGIGLSDADSFENVQRFLERNPSLSFVAIDGDELVATILCGHDGRRGSIHHLAVAPTHQRRGLGRKLAARVLSGLREVGIQKCHLLVFRDNAEGKLFWERVGAEERTTLSIFSLAT